MGGAAIATNRTAASWLALSVSKSIRRISLVRCLAWPARRSEVHGNGPKSIPSTGDDPGRIEPSVRRAVIGEPRDVPMADERGVGGPDRGASADIDHAVGIAGNHVCRLLAGAYRHDGAVRMGKSRDGSIGCGAEQDDVAARQLEETLDVRGVFRALRAFPRHAPVEAELTAPTDGAHRTYIGHRSAFPRCGQPFARCFGCGSDSVLPAARPLITITDTSAPPRDVAEVQRTKQGAGSTQAATNSRSIAHCPPADCEKMLSPRRANHSDG